MIILTLLHNNYGAVQNSNMCDVQSHIVFLYIQAFQVCVC